MFISSINIFGFCISFLDPTTKGSLNPYPITTFVYVSCSYPSPVLLLPTSSYIILPLSIISLIFIVFVYNIFYRHFIRKLLIMFFTILSFFTIKITILSLCGLLWANSPSYTKISKIKTSCVIIVIFLKHSKYVNF